MLLAKDECSLGSDTESYEIPAMRLSSHVKRDWKKLKKLHLLLSLSTASHMINFLTETVNDGKEKI